MAATDKAWTEIAKRHLKATLKLHGIGYAQLAELLTDMSLPETEGSVTVKINRGAYPAWWLFAVMRAIGAHTLHLE